MKIFTHSKKLKKILWRKRTENGEQQSSNISREAKIAILSLACTQQSVPGNLKNQENGMFCSIFFYLFSISFALLDQSRKHPLNQIIKVANFLFNQSNL